MAENEEIIATRLGSWYYHDKAGTDEGWAVHTEQLPLPAVKSLAVSSPRTGLMRECRSHGSCTQLLLGALFLLLPFFPPIPFCLLIVLLKGTLENECDGTGWGGKAWWPPGSSGAGGFQIPPFPKGKGSEAQRGRWMVSWCAGHCPSPNASFQPPSCQQPPQPSASQFSSFWKLLFDDVQCL